MKKKEKKNDFSVFLLRLEILYCGHASPFKIFNLAGCGRTEERSVWLRDPQTGQKGEGQCPKHRDFIGKTKFC